jgi:hypothetical protein
MTMFHIISALVRTYIIRVHRKPYVQLDRRSTLFPVNWTLVRPYILSVGPLSKNIACQWASC